MNRYLITGSSGFIGSHLCARLRAQGQAIRTASRSSKQASTAGEHWCANLNTNEIPFGLLQETGVVIHLAGLAHQPAARKVDAKAYFDINRDATVALAQAACDAGVRKFVFVSSVKAARYDAKREPNDETVTAWPEDPYGVSKRQAEEALLHGAYPGMDVVVVRPSLVYGAGVKGNLRSMLLAVRRGWFPRISGGGLRSMVSVNDLCDALVKLSLAENQDGALYIVTDDQGYTIERIGMAMRRACGKQGSGLHIHSRHLRRVAEFNDALGRRLGAQLPISGVLNKLVANECYSSARLQQSLAWQPSRTLENELPAMVEYLEAGCG